MDFRHCKYTTYRSVYKVKILSQQEPISRPQEPPIEMQQLYNAGATASRIQNTIYLDNSLNSAGEDLALIESDLDTNHAISHAIG